MGLHLAEISARVTPGKHCALLVDQAGWHMSERLAVPSNITVVPLPAKCPELNPVENVWQFMRDNWLSNRVFPSYDAIVDHCCYAWNQLVDRALARHVHRIARLGHGSRSVSLGISPDPAGLDGSTRPQAYVSNPLLWTDPLGLAGNCCLTSRSRSEALNKQRGRTTFRQAQVQLPSINLGRWA